jgi:hypothetical protein
MTGLHHSMHGFLEDRGVESVALPGRLSNAANIYGDHLHAQVSLSLLCDPTFSAASADLRSACSFQQSGENVKNGLQGFTNNNWDAEISISLC